MILAPFHVQQHSLRCNLGGALNVSQRCFRSRIWKQPALADAYDCIVENMRSVSVFHAVPKPTPFVCATPLSPERSGEEDGMLLRAAAGHCWVWFLEGDHSKQR